MCTYADSISWMEQKHYYFYWNHMFCICSSTIIIIQRINLTSSDFLFPDFLSLKASVQIHVYLGRSRICHSSNWQVGLRHRNKHLVKSNRVSHLFFKVYIARARHCSVTNFMTGANVPLTHSWCKETILRVVFMRIITVIVAWCPCSWVMKFIIKELC